MKEKTVERGKERNQSSETITRSPKTEVRHDFDEVETNAKKGSKMLTDDSDDGFQNLG